MKIAGVTYVCHKYLPTLIPQVRPRLRRPPHAPRTLSPASHHLSTCFARATPPPSTSSSMSGCVVCQCGQRVNGSRGVPAGECELGTTRTFSSRATVRSCLRSLLLPLPPSPSPLRSAFSLSALYIVAASTLKYFHHAQRALPSAASRPPPPHSQPAFRARAFFPALLPSPPFSPSPRSSPPPPKLSPD